MTSLDAQRILDFLVLRKLTAVFGALAVNIEFRSQMKALLLAADADPDLSGFVHPEQDLERIPISDGDVLVGFLTPRQDPDGVWRTGAIYIAPTHRRKGLARQAIARFMEVRRGRAFIEYTNASSGAAFRAAGFHKAEDVPAKAGAWWQNFDDI